MSTELGRITLDHNPGGKPLVLVAHKSSGYSNETEIKLLLDNAEQFVLCRMSPIYTQDGEPVGAAFAVAPKPVPKPVANPVAKVQ